MSQQNPDKRNLNAVFLFGAIAIALVIGLFFANQQLQNVREPVEEADSPLSEFETQGVIDLEPKQLNDFLLQDTENDDIKLSDLSGNYNLIYFGYTYCPDFCPTTLATYRQVKRLLGEDSSQVNFVMISVDPKRDTPEALDLYLSRFDEEFIGITASLDDVTEDDAIQTLMTITEDFGAFFAINDGSSSPYYTVDHSATKFLVDPEGNLVAQYSYTTPVDVIVEDLRARFEG